MNTIARCGRGLTLALAIGLFAPVPPPALAQEQVAETAEATEESGKPIYGYLAAGAFTVMILFVICMSARR